MVFKIPEEINNQLGTLAAKEEHSKAFLIRKAIEKYLEVLKHDSNKK